MPLTLLAHATGLAGGLAWLVRWPLDGAAAGAAYWLGFVLLAAALAAYGAGLVTAGWLRVLIAVALPVLVWSVVVVLRGDGEAPVVDALVGLVMAVVGATGLARDRGRSPRSTAAPVSGGRRRSTHAR